MKFGLNWIRNYVDVTLSTAELAERLSMNGLAVEGIESPPSMDGIVVGRVLEVAKHPNADKLSLTKVDIGNAVLDIVCGAPNVKAGQLVPVATIGAVMPGGFEIKKAKIRGQESNGMICSRSELGFEKEKSPGIWELDDSQPHTLGMPFSRFIGGDTIFDLDISSNRPDLLNMIGIAREIAVIEKTSVRLPPIELNESSASTSDAIQVRIEDTDGCHRYAARILKGIRVGPSPAWLVQRLESVGQRSINTIVDVTNFVMLEMGQPLHAFDYDRIAGQKITVRRSQAGSRFTTLDGKTHTLDDQAILICDAERAVALGGIMGGQNSEINDATAHILLEAAWFHPTRIRRTARKLGIQTDASQRFERGVDEEATCRALDRACQLIQQISGGQLLLGAVDVVAVPPERVVIELPIKEVTRLLGLQIPAGDIAAYLRRIGCTIESQSSGVLRVVPPSYRRDLRIREDLIEEVARVHGYNRIPNATGAYITYHDDGLERERLAGSVRELLSELGIDEAVTNSMVSAGEQLHVVPDAAFVRLKNPINDDMAVMRASLLPGLLHVVRGNLFRKNMDVRVYEIGRTFRKTDAELPEERTWITGCLTGRRFPTHWDGKNEAIDFFDVKAVFTSLANKFHLDSLRHIGYDKSSIFTDEARQVFIGQSDRPIVLGNFGRLNRTILSKFDIDVDVFAFQIDYDALAASARFQPTFREVPRFPFVRRDLALILRDEIESEKVLEFVKTRSGPLLESVEIFDRYTGQPIAKGEHSLAFSLTFQALDRTLTENEVDTIMQELIYSTEKEFGARLRT